MRLQPRHRIAALCAALLVVGYGPDRAAAQSIEELVEESLRTDVVGTGAVVGLRHEGTVAPAEAWGHRTGDGVEPLQADAVFPFPGMTEVLVATTVRALHARGTVDVNDPIGEYLPGLPTPIARVTLDQLLRHTAGLDDAAVPANMTLEEVVADLPGHAIFAPPGAVYSRSRYSYPLASRVLEEHFQLGLEEIVARALLRPLGMTRTTLDPDEGVSRLTISGYVPSRTRRAPGDSVPPPTRVGGLPVLYTAAPDVVHFFGAWLDGSIQGAGPDLLPGPPERPAVRNALLDGFRPSLHGAQRGLVVAAASDGFTAEARLYPETGTVIVSWANGSGRAGLAALPGRVSETIAERLLGPDFPVEVAEDAPAADNAKPLSVWAGRYLNGDRIIVLRPPSRDLDGAGLVVWDGNRELPVDRASDGRLLARLPGDGRIAFSLVAFQDEEGRRYVHMGGRSFARQDG